MANKIMYTIVGRYMDGKEVTGYHLIAEDRGNSGFYTKEQVYFLVGRGQVVNCSGQIFKDKVLLRGIGVDLNTLPVKQVNGGLSRTESIGKIRRGTTDEQAMSQIMIVQAIVNGQNTVGYVLENAGKVRRPANRATVLQMAEAGRIGNARVQRANGKIILRGVGTNLNELPTVPVSQYAQSKK